MLNKRERKSIYGWMKDCRGISYVEMLITLAILTAVLTSAYLFMNFVYKSTIHTQAKYDATQDARVLLIQIGSNIRKAQAVRIGATAYKAVQVNGTGTEIIIYVDIDNDDTCEMVQYRLDGDSLVRGQAELGSTPTSWSTVIDKVQNRLLATPKPIFTIDHAKVVITLYIKDEYSNLSDPIYIETSYTVRSKEAM